MTHPSASTAVLEAHLQKFFRGHVLHKVHAEPGNIDEVVPGFEVAVIGPGPQTKLWTYASLGAHRATPRGHEAIEFVCVVREPNPILVERLAMVAYYHATEGLGEGHTFPVGEPWVANSTLDHVLVSLPYPFGPDLENLETAHGVIRYLWLLPITAAERRFKEQAGQEALESRFDDVELEFDDMTRASVV